ncbi:glycine receptor subunit alpha-3-like isoform X2 [Clytia hemisphaerica]|uniref:glycine receptor subunit alpha-3-like isoform X2 n=1 Tax=Clytia hemisphaerica TaxID=252671 RepID=UPI0034D664B4
MAQYRFIKLWLAVTHFTAAENHTLDHVTSSLIYEKNVRPLFYQRQPVHVNVSFTVIASDDIQVQTGDFRLELNFMFEWNDPRLKHEHGSGRSAIVIDDPAFMDEIWLPDIFVVNAKKVSEDALKHIEIFENGDVRYMLRLNIRASCHIELQMFPWDMQRCPLILRSYSYASEHIQLHWSEKVATNHYVNSMYKRPMAQFNLSGFELLVDEIAFEGEMVSSVHSDENEKWSALEAVFTFSRMSGFYLIQTLAPSNILVVLSWVNFLIQPEDSPPRVFLGISCILTMAAIQNYINFSLPKVSYIKIIDVYCLTCYFFVVLVMVEYAIVLLLNERVKKENIFRQEKKIPAKKNSRIQQISSFCKFWPNLKLCIYGNPFCMHVTKRAVRLVDKASMVLFPTAYILFNIIYWTHVTQKIESTQNQDHGSLKDFFL